MTAAVVAENETVVSPEMVTASVALATAVSNGVGAPGNVGREGRRVLNVFGVEVEILIGGAETGGAETGGAYVLCRVGAEPGMGAPPHIHVRDDEAFYVLEGTFEFLRDGETLRLGPGEHVFLPRGVPHAFRNVGEQKGWVLEMATPSGHEKFFEDASRLSFPPEPAEAAAVCQRHGIELLTP